MTIDEAIYHVKNNIRYKPNSKIFASYDNFQDVLKIHINMQSIDLNNPELEARIANENMFTRQKVEMWGTRDLVAEVYKIVRQMEIHESEEWFRFNGKRCRDPHPEIDNNEQLAFGENF